MSTAPSHTGALTASATTSPRTIIEQDTAAGTHGSCSPRVAAAKPVSIVATNAVGHTQGPPPPASTPHTPTVTTARTWSIPPTGCASPVAKDVNGSTAACAGLTKPAVPSVTIARLRVVMTRIPLANRVMNGHELRAIRKSCFHLHLQDHLRDAFHDVGARQNLAALRHEIGHRFPVPRSLQDEVHYQRDALGIIDLDASRPPAAGNACRQRDHQ